MEAIGQVNASEVAYISTIIVTITIIQMMSCRALGVTQTNGLKNIAVNIIATIYYVDDEDSAIPYLVEDEDGQTSWWNEEDLELINE